MESNRTFSELWRKIETIGVIIEVSWISRHLSSLWELFKWSVMFFYYFFYHFFYHFFFLTTHTHHDKEHRSCSEAHEIRCSKKILFVGGCSERERLQITNKRNRNRVKSKRRRWVTQGDEMCDYLFSIMCMHTHIYIYIYNLSAMIQRGASPRWEVRGALTLSRFLFF